MRAWELKAWNDLALTEREVVSLEPGHVRLRMRAACLNYRDLLTVRGHYNPRQPLPLVPCSDGVGVVEAVGEGVTRVAIGDRVAPIFCQKWIDGAPSMERLRSSLGGPLDGTLQEQMVLHEDGLVHVPDHLTDTEAATLPCAAVTAWNAMVTFGAVSAGSTVLLQGTGGVSIFALQLAKLLGARVIITSSSDEKLGRARALGADETINYLSTPKWGKAARALTGGRGVDCVVEVGGAGTLEHSLRAVAVGGQISLIGVLDGGAAKLNIVPILMQHIRVQGILVGHRASFEALNAAISQHTLRPVLDRTFTFDETPAAFEHLASQRHFGKIVIDFQ